MREILWIDFNFYIDQFSAGHRPAEVCITQKDEKWTIKMGFIRKWRPEKTFLFVFLTSLISGHRISLTAEHSEGQVSRLKSGILGKLLCCKLRRAKNQPSSIRERRWLVWDVDDKWKIWNHIALVIALTDLFCAPFWIYNLLWFSWILINLEDAVFNYKKVRLLHDNTVPMDLPLEIPSNKLLTPKNVLMETTKREIARSHRQILESKLIRWPIPAIRQGWASHIPLTPAFRIDVIVWGNTA